MASTLRAPKQWCLTKNETVTSFENWRENLMYTLSLDKNFAPFLVADTWWEKKTKTTPYRGFSDDDENIPEANRITKEQKVNILELLLGQTANYCPAISCNTIVKNSSDHSDQIWQTIRLNYGFQTTGAHFIDFDCIRFDPIERPEVKHVYTKVTRSHSRHSDLVQVDPDNMLCDNQKAAFRNLLIKFDDVFNPNFKGSNGAVIPLEAKVNMGPVQPPKRKGRVPQYSKNQLATLHQKFDELENIGVFKRPEDVGITVEYVNPSFLIKKPNGSLRLVTTFADVGRYSKPQPSLMPDIDSTLRQTEVYRHHRSD